MNNKISERIKLLRESRGYSQEFVSKKLHISQQAYSNIENNPEKTSIEKMIQIAKILDVSLISIIEEEGIYLQHNFNQQGGNAATQMTINHANMETVKILERYIVDLKNEIEFLKKIITEKHK